MKTFGIVPGIGVPFDEDHVAYVKPITMNGVPAHMICGADGTQLDIVIGGRDAAFSVVRMNNFEPMSVH